MLQQLLFEPLQLYLLVWALLIIILFFFIYRSYRLNRLLKLQSLKNKIASDLYSDIGHTLCTISILSDQASQRSQELAPTLNQITESSREMVKVMSDTVWTINCEDGSFENIVMRMSSLLYELGKEKNIDSEFEADSSLY